MIFSLANQEFDVPPIVTESPLRFGEHFRGQAGAGYSTVCGFKLSIGLEFPRLSKEEADILKQMCYATSDSVYSEMIMYERERVFDGETFNTVYGRVLNRVKVVSFDFKPLDGKYDDETVSADSGSLESASVTVEEI
jgi:hypothetical protein